MNDDSHDDDGNDMSEYITTAWKSFIQNDLTSHQTYLKELVEGYFDFSSVTEKILNEQYMYFGADMWVLRTASRPDFFDYPTEVDFFGTLDTDINGEEIIITSPTFTWDSGNSLGHRDELLGPAYIAENKHEYKLYEHKHRIHGPALIDLVAKHEEFFLFGTSVSKQKHEYLLKTSEDTEIPLKDLFILGELDLPVSTWNEDFKYMNTQWKRTFLNMTQEIKSNRPALRWLNFHILEENSIK